MALSTEKKVGIFFLAALILLGTVIEFVEGWSPFEKKDPYHAFFKTAVGIRSGDPVRLSGVEVGKIVSITIADSRVRLDFTVQAGTTIREDSQAEIQQTNFLGGHFLGISFGTPESPLLTPGSTVASREATSINQLISNLNRNQEKVLENSEISFRKLAPLSPTALNASTLLSPKLTQGRAPLANSSMTLSSMRNCTGP